MSVLTRKPAPRIDPVRNVRAMPNDPEAIRFARNAGLNINTVSWEDNARDKDSCWGPCISDMTLSVDGSCMPLIKDSDNFNDVTWDVEIERIPLVVGNEDGTMLRTVTLKEYLRDLRGYLSEPHKWAGSKSSLLVEGQDKHVICSAQACFLPVPAQGEAKFNVALANYQSRPSDPAVLVIMASANGTSAQVVESSSQTLMYHNNKGQRASFVGQRLSDFRVETGSSRPGDSPMSASEKSQNMLLVIQVPLKQKLVMNYFDCYSDEECDDEGGCFNEDFDCVRSSESRCVDVEAAIVKVGEDEGPFAEINGVEIERDDRYPIRVTMQYYKATSNGAVDDLVMSEIAAELQGARKWAVAISSLVTETTDRNTEHIKVPIVPKASVAIIPPWWEGFWTQHALIYSAWSANAAQAAIFANGRFASAKLVDAMDEMLDILGKGPLTA